MKVVSKLIIGLGFLAVSNLVNAVAINGTSTGLTSPATTLTFDEVVLATNSTVTNEYSAFGVTFSGLFYDSSCCIEGWTPDGSSPYLGNITTSTGSYQSWSILFDVNQSDVAFTMASNYTTHTLGAYLDGVLVEEFAVDGSVWGYYGFANSNFNEIRMTANQAMLIDGLQFSTALPVPEASSLALLGLGLIGFGIVRRKK